MIKSKDISKHLQRVLETPQMINKRLRSALIIENPNSGSKINRMTERKLLTGLIKIIAIHKKQTEYKGHAASIIADNFEDYDFFMAVGGDGTVNETARALMNSQKSLAIIPGGSGNGLAKELGLYSPIHTLDAIWKNSRTKIDAIQVNEHVSFNVCGVGFDSYISHLFNSSKTRGLFTYLQYILKGIRSYKSVELNVEGDGFCEEGLFFSVTLANSRQFGNNAIIAPQAKLNDGLIDVVLIRPFPRRALFSILYHFVTRSMHKSKYTHFFQTDHLTITSKTPIQMHIDGDPIDTGNVVKAHILKDALDVFYLKRAKAVRQL